MGHDRGVTCLFGVALLPGLISSILGPDSHLTIVNASSSEKTPGILFVITMPGLPFVVAYTSVVYRIFRGKVQISK